TGLRGGLLYEVRFTVFARQELKKAILVLSPDWLYGQTMNTLEPTPLGQASKNGSLEFTLGHIPAGQKFILTAQFQGNPTSIGTRSQSVELDDGPTPLLTIHRSATFFP